MTAEPVSPPTQPRIKRWFAAFLLLGALTGCGYQVQHYRVSCPGRPEVKVDGNITGQEGDKGSLWIDLNTPDYNNRVWQGPADCEITSIGSEVRGG